MKNDETKRFCLPLSSRHSSHGSIIASNIIGQFISAHEKECGCYFCCFVFDSSCSCCYRYCVPVGAGNREWVGMQLLVRRNSTKLKRTTTDDNGGYILVPFIYIFCLRLVFFFFLVHFFFLFYIYKWPKVQ